MKSLQERFDAKDFKILAFPSDSFGQEKLGEDSLLAWAEASYGVNYSMFEKVVVNGDDAHPIFRKLKAMCRKGKGIENLKFNFDKILLDCTAMQVVENSTAAKKKPLAYVAEIEAFLAPEKTRSKSKPAKNEPKKK